MIERFKDLGVLKGFMELGHNATDKGFNRKLNYLEWYLREHPEEDTSLTAGMKAELEKTDKGNRSTYHSPELQQLYSSARKIRREEREENEAIYSAQWEGYGLELNIPTPFNPEHDTLDVRIIRQDGKEYEAQFVTRSYLDHLFEKNRRTDECASGTYFWMPGMIIMDKKITENTVRRTIDSLIEDYSMDHFSQEEDI